MLNGCSLNGKLWGGLCPSVSGNIATNDAITANPKIRESILYGRRELLLIWGWAINSWGNISNVVTYKNVPAAIA